MTETIDMTPNWLQAARIYLLAAQSGTSQGRQTAERAILDMGELLDRLAEDQPDAFARCREGLSL